MKFAKCPRCGESQGFINICFVSSFGTRTCEHCGTEYESIQSKVIPITFIIIVPLIFGHYLPIFSSYPLLSFAWAFVWFAILLKYMPLKVAKR